MKVLVLRDITTLKGTLVSLKFISFLSIVNYMILKDNWPIMNKWTPLSTILPQKTSSIAVYSMFKRRWPYLLRTTTIEKWTPIITGGNNTEGQLFPFLFLFFFFANWNFLTCPPSKLNFFALIATLIGRVGGKLVKRHLNITNWCMS